MEEGNTKKEENKRKQTKKRKQTQNPPWFTTTTIIGKGEKIIASNLIN